MPTKNYERNTEIIRLLEEEGVSVKEVTERLDITKDVVNGVRRRWRLEGAGLNRTGKLLTEGTGNEQIVTLPSQGIMLRTLEDLVKFAKIDLDEWSVTKWVANFWGNRDNANTQVKAWLARHKPIAIHPIISPVEIKLGRIPATSSEKSTGRKRALVLFDAQVGFSKSLETGELTPFHDRLAMDIAFQIAKSIKPDLIVFGGDWLDLADWTDKYARSPEMYWTTQPAVLEAAWWLAQFRKVTSGELKKLEGNHEARMPRKVVEHLKEAYGLKSVNDMELPPMLSIPRLLALHELDIEWYGDYPNGQIWINDRLSVEHGTKAKAQSGATVTDILKDIQESVIVGHAHRIELAYKTLYGRAGGRGVFAFSPGCLCRVDGSVPGTKERQNWQQGIGVIDYFDDGRHYPQAVPIVHGKAYFEDREYTGKDRVEDLRQATGWQF